MLLRSDAAVAARDPGLPGLPVLLDDDAVGALLGAPVRRDYLRYKPGTSCVLAARVALKHGCADVLVAAYDDEGAVKIDKTVAATPRGTVLHVDRARGLVAVVATADRDLPFLAALSGEKTRRRALAELLPARSGLASARVRTLSYKPMRRWVGLLTPRSGAPVVLRAYRAADAPQAAAVVRELTGGPVRTPALLGVHGELACLALEYVEGRSLDLMLALDDVDAGRLAEVGRALALLHDRRRTGLPVRTAGDDVAAVRAAAAQVGGLLPELGERAHVLAEELALRLARLPVDAAVVHGDFSTDQVVLGPGGVALLDLDRAVVGDAAADLASLVAAAASADSGAGPNRQDLLAQVTAGYAGVRTPPTSEAVRTHTSALLLRRVAEPFRRCLPDWEERAHALLAQACAVLPGPLACGVDDLVVPAVGGAVSWEVLKDKPGRRRTSRATGPGGTAIVKIYASARAPVVARRVCALQSGPVEPRLPRVLACDEARHVLVLTEVPGTPFRDAVLAGDAAAAARVGRALATWHAAHRGRVPAGLRPHTGRRETEILLERCAAAPADVAALVRKALPAPPLAWPVDTVVHRDLYEDQIVLADVVGLLDLDDAAAGPAELDVGNLLAHLELLGRRSGVDVAVPRDALLAAYVAQAPLDDALLERCRVLSLLRLACVHADVSLVPGRCDERTLISSSPAAHRARQR